MNEIATDDIFESVVIAMKRLVVSVKHESNNKSLKEIKNSISLLKNQLNKIGLDMSLAREDKIELFFSLYNEILDIANRYQLNFHNRDNPLFEQNFIELRILNQYLLWVIVCNAKDQHKFSFQVSANLLSKVMESQSFEVNSEFSGLSDLASLDEFGRIFNYHTTSGGLLSSAILLIPQIHIDNAKIWATQAFYHFKEIYVLLDKLDIEKLYKLTLLDDNREFLTLATIFIYPSLEFIKFIKGLNQIFGEDWYSILELDEFQSMTKIRFLKKTFRFFNNLGEKVLSTLKSKQIDLYTNKSWSTFNKILSVLGCNALIVEKFKKCVIEGLTITDDVLLETRNLIGTLYNLQDTITQLNSSFNYFIEDSIEKLIILNYHKNSSRIEKLATLEDVFSSFTLDINIHNHGLILLYTITKFNLIQNAPLDEIKRLLSFVQDKMSLITVNSSDSLMLRIFYILIQDHFKMIDNLSILKLLDDVIKQYQHSSAYINPAFTEYVDHLKDSYQGKNSDYSASQNLISEWEWRHYILPKLDISVDYIPLNQQSSKILFDQK